MEVSQQMKDGFEDLYATMVRDGIVKFPTKDQINIWEGILDEWVSDKTLPLFRRKPSGGRGSQVIHEAGRALMITDNTPAHWVYRTAVLNADKPTFSIVREAIRNNTFPIAMMMKKVEKEFLLKSQVSNSSFRLGNENWKVAHIEPIALSRQQNLTIEQYEAHHRKFLSLSNMYLIRKDYSGIAEVALFNGIVMRHKNIRS